MRSFIPHAESSDLVLTLIIQIKYVSELILCNCNYVLVPSSKGSSISVEIAEKGRYLQKKTRKILKQFFSYLKETNTIFSHKISVSENPSLLMNLLTFCG